MSEVKYGADLLNNGRVGGHIVISETTFIWKPVKFAWFGNVEPIEIPLSDLEGYIKDGTTLYIGAHGLPEYMAFYTYKGQSIIDVITNNNPNFRMYASNEYTKKSSGNGCMVVIALIILSSISISFLI